MQQKKRFLPILGLVTLILSSLACGPTSIGPSAEDVVPVVVITAPGDGSSVILGDPVNVEFAAQYEEGMERVELMVNGSKSAEMASPDSSETGMLGTLTWSPQEEGNFVLTVVAYGVGNAISEPAYVNLVVEAASTADAEDGEGADLEESSSSDADAPEAVPPTEEPASEPPEETCTMDADFVSDVTIPDGTELDPDSSFTKTWRIRNSGTCDWDGVQLIFSSGPQMDGPSVAPVPDASPGSEVDISVNLKAPTDPGDYTGYWKLRSDGSIFGTNLIVVINVPEEEDDDDDLVEIPPMEINPGIVIAFRYVETITENVYIDAGEIGYVTASCPSESIVTGGGFASQNDLFMYNSSQSGNGWRVYARNNGSQNRLMRVYAVCMHNSGGSSTQRYDQISIPASTVGYAEASCPAGTVATGGGWAGNSTGTLIVYNSSLYGNNWRVYARNISGSSELLNSYVTCVSDISGSSSSSHQQVSVPDGSWNNANGICSSGLRTGGGFATSSDEDVWVYNTTPNSSDITAWSTYARNNTGSSVLLNSYAVCLSFD